MHVKFDDKELGDETPEQDDIACSEESDDYSEPDQTLELNGTSEPVTALDTPEAATAPDVPIAEASDEAHNDSQQVILSRNSFKYKSSHPGSNHWQQRKSQKNKITFQTRRVCLGITVHDRTFKS